MGIIVVSWLPLLLLAIGCAPGTTVESIPQEQALAEARERMVRAQLESRGIRDHRVLRALRQVPRHLFVRPDLRSWAYEDSALPTESGQTISQPYIVAVMTEAIRPEAGYKVLEIGTGSGYQAAVLSVLVKQVHSVELLPSLARSAAERLKKLGYNNVQVHTADGWRGWAEQAPYDAILVTAAPDEIPSELVAQLKPGGRMVLPLGQAGEQELILIEKDSNGRTSERRLLAVSFVPLVKPH